MYELENFHDVFSRYIPTQNSDTVGVFEKWGASDCLCFNAVYCLTVCENRPGREPIWGNRAARPPPPPLGVGQRVNGLCGAG